MESTTTPIKREEVFHLKSIISGLDKDLQTYSHVSRFIKRFDVLDCLKAANINKVKGFPLASLFQFLFTLVFTHKNFYRHMDEKITLFGKDIGYRFLNNPNSNWRLFMLKLATAIINTFLEPLTRSDHTKVLIVDDSLFSRNRSKKVELLAKVFDHTQHRYFKGFRKLTVGWSDGASFIPLAFSLLSSKDPKNRLYEQGPTVPEHSPGNARRKEAVLSTNIVLLSLLDEVLEHTRAFSYVLFDSWFGWPKLIKEIKSRKVDVICMLKNMPHISYGYNGASYRLSDLYASIGKTGCKSDIITSALVDCDGIPARIVFVRNRHNKREWLAILSTDITIPEEEIIRIYGMRWDIEVYFKMCKSFLGLAKEFQMRSYDGMIAHTTLVSMRYMLLSIENRDNKDDRTAGGIFYDLCAEIENINLAQSLSLLLDLLAQSLRDELFLASDAIDGVIENFMNLIPSYLKRRLTLNTAA
jgi:hypothetical protein